MDDQTSPQASTPTDNPIDIKKILLIEDEEPIRLLYKRQLELANFKIDAYGTGAEGMEAYEKNQYDLVLLDVMLPDTNGIDILNILSQKGMLNKAPFVLLTNLAQHNIIKDGFSKGILGYLIKSQHTPQQIVNEVKNFLASSDK